MALVCEEDTPNLNFSVSKVITNSIVLSTDPRTFLSRMGSQRSPPDRRRARRRHHPTSGRLLTVAGQGAEVAARCGLRGRAAAVTGHRPPEAAPDSQLCLQLSLNDTDQLVTCSQFCERSNPPTRRTHRNHLRISSLEQEAASGSRVQPQTTCALSPGLHSPGLCTPGDKGPPWAPRALCHLALVSLSCL